MARLVENRFGSYYPGLPHHNTDAYRKCIYKKAIEEIFPEHIEKSKYHRIRTKGDFHRSAIDFYALATEQAHLEYVKRKDSLRNQIYRDNARKRLNKYKPQLFCMNDNQKAGDADRRRMKAFLESYFPEKSSFEHWPCCYYCEIRKR